MSGQSSRSPIALLSTIAVALALPALVAAPPPMTTKVLLRAPLSGDPAREVVVVSGELAVGGVIPRHSHPGDEYGTVLAGRLEIQADGQRVRHISAGESYHNANGVIHATMNAGDGVVRLLSTFVIEKGQPLILPAGSPAAD